MPWCCPACRIPIRHSEVEERPRPRTLYRCHVCRLELVFDPATEKLTVAPNPDEDDGRKAR
jgi:hypothetical protein